LEKLFIYIARLFVDTIESFKESEVKDFINAEDLGFYEK
jgi:hypothetical protein